MANKKIVFITFFQLLLFQIYSMINISQNYFYMNSNQGYKEDFNLYILASNKNITFFSIDPDNYTIADSFYYFFIRGNQEINANTNSNIADHTSPIVWVTRGEKVLYQGAWDENSEIQESFIIDEKDEPNLEFKVEFLDEESGIDIKTIHFFINEKEIIPGVEKNQKYLLYRAPVGQKTDLYVCKISVTDKAGNTTEVIWEIFYQEC